MKEFPKIQIDTKIKLIKKAIRVVYFAYTYKSHKIKKIALILFMYMS